MSPRTRSRSSRSRRDARQRRVLLVSGAAAIVVAFGLLYVAFKSPTGIPFKPYYNVTARFRSVGTLDIGANVTVAGRLVGQVVDIRTVDGTPTIDLQMNAGTTHLPVGTTARIRPRGLLGAEYIDLTPSTAKRRIPDNGIIPVRDTSAAEQLSDVTAGLTAPARTHLQQLINGLGAGVFGRGTQLNQTLSVAPGTLDELRSGIDPLVHSDATPGLIDGADAVSGQLDPVTGDFATGLRDGAKSLKPLSDEAPSVSALLEQAPGEMTSIDASLRSTDTTLGHLSRFSTEATRFSALAPRALSSLTRVLVDRRPLGAARTLLTNLQGAIAPTEQMTRTLNPELPHLSRLFDTLSPVLTTISPYGCDLQGFANNWRGFLGTGSDNQSGPLGPYTTLRLVLAAPGSQLGGSSAIGTIQSDTDPAPCVGTGGP